MSPLRTHVSDSPTPPEYHNQAHDRLGLPSPASALDRAPPTTAQSRPPTSQPTTKLQAGTLEDESVPVTPDETTPAQAASGRRGKGSYPSLKSAVARLSALRRTGATGGEDSNAYDWGSSSLGAEPGIDAHKATLNDLKGPCKVQVVDWSADKVVQRRFDQGDDFLIWFDHEQRKDWVKARWINVEGPLQWDVLKAIALEHDLHPLALEDAVKTAAHSHSKADWYSTQLFTRLLIHSLSPPISSHGTSVKRHRSGPFHRLLVLLGMNRSARHARDVLAGDLENAGTFFSKKSTDEGEQGLGLEDDDGDSSADEKERAGDERLEEQLAARAVVEHLTEKFRVPVDKQQLSTFLLPSGTIISIFTRSGEDLTASLFERLDTPGTLLRSTEDCSMLLQALLDVVVDDALELTEEFRRELDILEGRALVNPDTTAVRHLHVMSGQLLMLKRTLTPLQGMIQSLRHDDERRSAVAKNLRRAGSSGTVVTDEGFISPEAKQYLADVNDHIDSVLTSLSLFSKIADSIVDFIFNSLSFASNESMKWLTLFSIIFLPLTFVSGYYGMNFAIFPDIGVFPEGATPGGKNPTGDINFFWKIMGPVLGVLVILLLISNFGSYAVSAARKSLHKFERHKHRKIIKQVRKTRRRKTKTA